MLTEFEIRRIALEMGLDLYNEKACAQCKGVRCCQHFPCFYAPSDFRVLRDGEYTHEQRVLFLSEYIKKTQRVSIDMISYLDEEYGPLNRMTLKPDIGKIMGDDGWLFLRARAANRPILDFQYFMGENERHPCMNWTFENGCALSKEERPYTGRTLIPGRNRNCIDLVDDAEFAYEWKKYKQLMYDVYLECQNLDGE